MELTTLILTLFLLGQGMTLNKPNPCFFTGKSCIETCFKKPAGLYQSCRACNEFIQCDASGVGHTQKTAPGTEWSGSMMVFRGQSTTCKECVCDTGNGWRPYNNNCYYISPVAGSWKEAELACENMDGSLVSVVDGAEEAFLARAVKSVNSVVSNKFWIGLLKMNDKWIWINQDTSLYTNWKANNPKGMGTCAIMEENGLWRDTSCDEKYNFICKKGKRRPDVSTARHCRDIGTTSECLYAKSISSWINADTKRRCRKTFGYCYDLDDPNDPEEKCRDGYTRRGVMCDSIDECREKPKGFIPCAKGVECEDLPFGYRCKCKWSEMEYVENNEIKCSNADTCYAAGDPHFSTLDGHHFNYQGTCEYNLFRVMDDSLVVTTKLDWRYAGHATSFVRIVTIRIRDGSDRYKVVFNGIHKLVTLQKNDGDDERVYSDLSFGNGYSISFRGNNFDSCQLKTRRGVYFELSDGQNMKVQAASALFKGKGTLDGMCGNYDGNSENDVPGGVLAFATKYKVGGKPGCELAGDLRAEPHFVDQCEKFYSYSILKYSLGECEKNIMSSRQLVQDCAIDLQVGMTKCQHFEPLFKTFAEKCSKQLDWRSAFNCPMECPEHSTYRPRMPLSVPACSEKPDTTTTGMFGGEGCLCDPGFLLSGTKCVKPEQCGCVVKNGPYIPSGDSVIRKIEGGYARITCNNTVATSDNVTCEGPCLFVKESRGYSCRAKTGVSDSDCKIVHKDNKPEIIPNDPEYDPELGDLVVDPDDVSACKNIYEDKLCKQYQAAGKCHNKSAMKNCAKTCAMCVNSEEPGVCEPGYVWTKRACRDINECVDGVPSSENSKPCAKGVTCRNTPGSFRCMCPQGQMLVETDKEQICVEAKACLSMEGDHWKNFADSWFWLNSLCDYVLLTAERSAAYPEMPHVEVKIAVKSQSEKQLTVTIGNDSLSMGKAVLLNGVEVASEASFGTNCFVRRNYNSRWLRKYEGNVTVVWELKTPYFQLTTLDNGNIYIQAAEKWVKALKGGVCVDDKAPEQKWDEFVVAHFARPGCLPPPPLVRPSEETIDEITQNITEIECLGTSIMRLRRDDYEYLSLLKEEHVDQCVIYEEAMIIIESQNGDCPGWKTRTDCARCDPMTSDYVKRTPTMVPTCINPQPASSEKTTEEGCLCKPGFLDSNGVCVKATECGCYLSTKEYIQKGAKKLIQSKGLTYEVTCVNYTTAEAVLVHETKPGFKVVDGEVKCLDSNNNECSYVRDENTFLWVIDEGYGSTFEEIVKQNTTDGDDDDIDDEPDDITITDDADVEEDDDKSRRGNDYCNDSDPVCVLNAESDVTYCSVEENIRKCPLTCGACKVADDCGKNYRMDTEKNTCFDIDECAEMDNPLIMSCPPDSVCKNIPNGYRCMCANGKVAYRKGSKLVCEDATVATCSVYGSGHFLTFDGVEYDFAGHCTYTMLEPSGEDEDGLVVKASMKRDERGVPLVNMVEITLEDLTLKLQDDKVFILVTLPGANSLWKELTLPQTAANKYAIRYVSTNHDIEVKLIDAGVTIVYKPNSYLKIMADSRYSGMVDGLCGDYNDDQSVEKDRMLGDVLVEFQDFITTISGELSPGTNCNVKPIEAHVNSTFLVACEEMFRSSPIGSAYLEEKSRDGYATLLNACAKDLEAGISQCKILENAAVKLETAIDWRTESCALPIPDNSKYYPSLNVTVPTCQYPVKGIQKTGEGFLCDEGYFESGDSCVKPEECGCFKDTYYRKSGETWYQKDSSNKDTYYKYVCTGTSMIRTEVVCPDPCRWVAQSQGTYVCLIDGDQCDVEAIGTKQNDINDGDFVAPKLPPEIAPTPTEEPTTRSPPTTLEEAVPLPVTLPVPQESTMPLRTTPSPSRETVRTTTPDVDMNDVDQEGEQADRAYYQLTLENEYYKIKPHDIIRGVVKNSGVTATTFLADYPPFYAVSSIKDAPGWSPDLSVKQRHCLTVDLGHVASVHGWMTMGGRLADGSHGYVKYYTVDVSVDGKKWSARELRHKPGVARVYIGNHDADTPSFHCEHRYRGTPMSIRYFRICLIEGQYSAIPQLRIIILGFREPRDPALLIGLLNDRYTLSLVGCHCYFDTSSTNCACCQPGAAQCGPTSPSQCVLAGFPKMCGTVHPRLPSDITFPGLNLDIAVEMVPATNPFWAYINEICPPGFRICSLDPFICKTSGQLRCPAIRIQPAILVSKEADYIMSGIPLWEIPDEILNFDEGTKDGETLPQYKPHATEPDQSRCICA